MERRKGPRIYEPFPVKVSGTDQQGLSFQMDTVVDNLSAGGLYTRLPLSVRRGANLHLMLRMSLSSDESAPVARVSAKGIVTRVESQLDGTFGVAVAFTHHRFR